ncbi:MAG: hypothetical protein IKB71_11435 [Lentisphaeria bacterium]|nr:hypothetical protein [Lentisphaeria bacterium]
MLTKLTLSMDQATIAKMRRISKRHRTSISAMVANYVATLPEETPQSREIPPITKRILEMGAKIPSVPKDWDYRDELADAMAERYGVK